MDPSDPSVPEVLQAESGRPRPEEANPAARRPWSRGGLAILAVVSMLSAGCRPKTVTIAVASRAEPLDAARLALEDDGPIPWLDTIMVPEEPATTASTIHTAERLVGIDGLIGVVGHVNSAASLAAARVYNGRGVVQIAPTSTATAYGEMGPYSFRLVPADDRQGEFLAAYLEGLKPTGGGVAILYVNDDYGRGLRASVVEHLEASTLEVVLDLPHVDADPEKIDFSWEVDAVRAAAPDMLLWLARAATLDRFLGLLREAGLHVPVVASDATASAVQYANRDGRWEGVRYVDFLDIGSTPELRAFRARYRARFATDVSGLDALHYDATRLLLAGIRAGSRTGADLRAYLLSLGRDRPPFQGITGPISFSPTGEVNRSYVMLEFEPRSDR